MIPTALSCTLVRTFLPEHPNSANTSTGQRPVPQHIAAGILTPPNLIALSPTPCPANLCSKPLPVRPTSPPPQKLQQKQTSPSTTPKKKQLTIPGKRIALPTRVEPKVFFANERTFLSWLNFTVILGGLAVGLLNFGDRVGRISAALFTVIAMAAMIYAVVTFHWRAQSIRRRGQSGFDDRFGPTILAIALLAAVVVNFILRMQDTEAN